MCVFALAAAPAVAGAAGAAGTAAATAATASAFTAANIAANVGVFSGILGTGMSMYGQMQQGQAAKAQANYQAQVAERNKQVLEYQAQDRAEQGQLQEEQQRLKVRQLMGTQRAALSASGVTLDDGSAVDLLTDTAAIGEMDAQTIRHNTAKDLWAIRNQQQGLDAESTLLMSRGKASAQAGAIGAASSLLGGANKVADDWYRFEKG
ncbi:hypothetical protein [Novispirillum itersonii]|uniref:hypothetical protein n=1 Tax=Novispirillum itersonii TaxID=189 RepID=UPI000364763F|nr:hypothetical protein [Novispirillum itersonii]